MGEQIAVGDRIEWCGDIDGRPIEPGAPEARTFVEIEDDARALIAATGDEAAVPGSYPYWWPLRLLTPAGDTAPGQ